MSTLPLGRAAACPHPAVGLLTRYRAVLRAAWTQRRELPDGHRTADELDFLPAALSLQDTPVHPAPRRLAWGMIVAFTIACLWSYFGQVDVVAVAQGRIIVSGSAQDLEHQEE